jgi:HSP20 family protein
MIMWDDENDDSERPESSIDRFFSQVFAQMDNPLFDIQSRSLKPLFRLEVGEEDVVIALDLPGVRKEDVEVTCTEDLVSVDAEIRKAVALRVSGTRARAARYERYSKKIRLPVRVDPNRASAKYRNGIVVIKLPILRTGKAVKIAGP